MRALGLVAIVLLGCSGGDTGDTDAGIDHDLDDDGYWGAVDDCDDSDPNVHPDADELCNGKDDDCDGRVDVDALDAPSFYRDADEDGHGRPNLSQQVCTQPDGYVPLGDDCDDDEDRVHPGATEVCGDNLDNDCDGNAGPCGLGGEEALAGADAAIIGTTNGGRLGDGLAGVGQVGGDGKEYVAIGSSRADRDGNDNAGRVYLLATPLSATVDLSTASAVLVGLSPSADLGSELGCGVSHVGDLTGDGVDDVLVDSSTNGAYVFAGPLSGERLVESAYANIRRGTTDAGCAGIAGLGDLDDDGDDDFAVSDVGGVALVLGDPKTATVTSGVADQVQVGSTGAGDVVPNTVAGPGDVDGDGRDDVLVGVPSEDTAGTNSGAAWLVLGPATGLTTRADADAKLVGEHAGDLAGYAVAGPADVDGDGHADLVIGAPGLDGDGGDAGGGYVVFGPILHEVSLAEADIRFIGMTAGDNAGASVATLDLDADGESDVALGAPLSDRGGNQGGAAFVAYGPTDLGVVDLFYAEWKLQGEAGWRAGERVANGRDTDGDGYDDLLIGAPRGGRDAGTAGAAYLFRGGPGI